MSETPEPIDPALLPTLQVEFPNYGHHTIDLTAKEQLTFLSKNKINVGDCFWLTDDDVRIKGTLQKVNGTHQVIIHWGTMQIVKVDG